MANDTVAADGEEETKQVEDSPMANSVVERTSEHSIKEDED